MKNFKILAMTLCCILAMGFAACSDDDDAVKTALKDPALSNVSAKSKASTYAVLLSICVFRVFNPMGYGKYFIF